MGMYGAIGQTASDMSGAGVDMIMSLIGRAQAQGDYDSAHQLYQKYMDQVNAADSPTYQTQTAQEDLDPQQISLDSSGRDAQQGAIGQLQSFVDQNGLDSSARAGLQQAQGQTEQQNQANRGAIMQGAARKGMQGSGGELASMLQGQQGSANQERNAGLSVAAQARQNALGALTSQANIAGQMRGQDVSTQTQNANAAQARNEFNAKMRDATQSANNAGAFTQYDANLAHLQQQGQAEGQMAQEYLRRAKQTQGDYSSVGQGLDYGFQAAGEGSADMPF